MQCWLTIKHWILSGLEWKKNKNSKITLTGTIDTKRRKQNDALAIERANNAKNYLVEKLWPIGRQNRSKGYKNFLLRPSAPKDPDGIAEKPSVFEIFASTSDITAPIVIEKDKQRIAAPDLIGFLPKIDANRQHYTLEYGNITVGADLFAESTAPRIKRKFNGWLFLMNWLQAKSHWIIHWKWRWKVVLSDSYSGSIPVDYFSFTRKKDWWNKPTKSVSKFSLVVFDFDSPKY